MNDTRHRVEQRETFGFSAGADMMMTLVAGRIRQAANSRLLRQLTLRVCNCFGAMCNGDPMTREQKKIAPGMANHQPQNVTIPLRTALLFAGLYCGYGG